MQAVGPPSSPEEIRPEWLTGALVSAGLSNGVTIAGINDIVEIGTGQAARNFRFHLSWERPGAGPATVIGKFPSTDASARATLEATGGYWKEWFFYDSVASTVDVRVPACFAAEFDVATSDFVLILEDIDDSVPGDQLEGLRADQLSLAIREAAALHGPRHGEPGLEALLSSGPGASTLGEAGPFCEEMYHAVLPQFIERFADAVESDALAFIERTAQYVSRWFRGTSSPVTLLHQDFRADNLLFSSVAAEPSVVVVDFQTLTAGVAATDVAYLIGGSTPDPHHRADIERDLLDEYRSRLMAYGVDRSSDDLWADYRYGSLSGVIMTVLSSIAAERTDRGELMFAAMANRHARHAAELEALELFR